MKLLLCINRFSQFDSLFRALDVSRASLPDPSSAHFMFSFHYLQHEIDVCETGFGMFQTTFKVTKSIGQKKYHLALKAGLCNAYKPELNIGDIVNVIKDKPGDIGIPQAEGFEDIYDLKWMDSECFPHYKGGFINMNNSYMNVLLPFKKVVSVTVNQYADVTTFETKREKYKADIETTDGLGFVYPCMYERQPFYQLNAVERNLATSEHDTKKALQQLNETLLDVLQKI